MFDSLVLETLTGADSGGARGGQLEERLAGAGQGWLVLLVLPQVQTEEGPEGGAGGRHHHPVARHAAAVRTDEYQVGVPGILRE